MFLALIILLIEFVNNLSPKGIPVDYNSLDVADLWIEKLLENFGDRVEYIHYKKL